MHHVFEEVYYNTTPTKCLKGGHHNVLSPSNNKYTLKNN